MRRERRAAGARSGGGGRGAQDVEIGVLHALHQQLLAASGCCSSQRAFAARVVAKAPSKNITGRRSPHRRSARPRPRYTCGAAGSSRRRAPPRAAAGLGAARARAGRPTSASDRRATRCWRGDHVAGSGSTARARSTRTVGAPREVLRDESRARRGLDIDRSRLRRLRAMSPATRWTAATRMITSGSAASPPEKPHPPSYHGLLHHASSRRRC